MTEIDYDELDKAVNSLVSNDNDSTNVANNTTMPTGVTPVVNPVVPNNSSSDSNAVSNDNQRRSRGRFMDVVHPSSSMRSSIAIPDRNTIPRQPVPTTPSHVSQPAAPVMSAPNRWSNIANLSSKSVDKPNMATNNSDEDADITKISEDITNSMNGGVPTESSDSPFLADAKVEKRPLGAFSNMTPTVEPTVDNDLVATNNIKDDLLVESSNDTLPTKVEEVEKPVVIDDAMSTAISQELESNVSPAVETPKPDAAVVMPDNSQSVTSPVLTTNPQPVAATSIPQQYKEQPSTGDQTNGAIYDTDAYHKALVQPVKKKNGWLWVLWIFLLLVVGAGAGAAVYFFILPIL